MIEIINESEILEKRRKDRNTNFCDRCGIKFDNKTGYPLKEFDINRNWTGRWDCRKCWTKYDQNPFKKQLRDHRTGNLRDPTKILGDNCEELTFRWLGAERLSVRHDNYGHLPLDHSPISNHIIIDIGDKLLDLYDMIVQTKGKLFNRLSSGTYGGWAFGNFEGEWHKEYDHAICYCTSEDGNDIERIYIFNSWEIIGRKTVNIVKNPSRHTPWYEQYRITDEEILKQVNQIWKKILEEKK